MASRVATVVDEGLGQLFSMSYGEIYRSVEGFSSRVPKKYPLVERLSSQVQKIYRSVERFSSRVPKMYSLVERLSSRVENRDRLGRARSGCASSWGAYADNRDGL